jgi:hypothetical protein
MYGTTSRLRDDEHDGGMHEKMHGSGCTHSGQKWGGAVMKKSKSGAHGS